MVLCGLRLPRILGPNVYPEAPDGGWGWVVAVAFFVVEICTYGFIKSFGIFLEDLMTQFGETNSRVSWVVSISVFVMTVLAPLSSVLTSRCGFQPVVMVGGLLIATGTITTGFTSSVNQMYVTTGIVAGLGYCLTFLPTVTILSQYFTRRRSLAIALASTGESLSMFALAPAFAALRDHIGWRCTMAVMGALQGSIIIFGAMLRPIIIKPKANAETDPMSPKELEALSPQENLEGVNSGGSVTDKPSFAQNTSCSQDNELTTGDSGIQFIKDSQQKWTEGSKEPETVGVNPPRKNYRLLDFSILKECSFIFYSLFGLFATLGFFAPQLYIIKLSVSRGVAREQATYMLSIMAVAEIVGRFAIGWILSRDRLWNKKLLVLLGCVITMTADLVGFTLVKEFYSLAVCCALYGFFMGTLSCTHIPLLAEDDVVGIERMSSAAGVYVFIQSFAGLAGPPLGGVLVDVTQNYGSAFYSCAAGMALSAVFLSLVKPTKTGLICKRRNSKKPEDTSDEKTYSAEQTGVRDPENRSASPWDLPNHNSEETTANGQEVTQFA
ncbi:monocarboxylate transporter 7-like [Thalassophryne amazonica]|uniref:monocarboxylate transporter 7-like n=1 Tax=Thalassophryne amazonica TaxID=390379 RepID=UPI001472024C|nr:monocarboxylate transporter 7-like [Thalassophryne amazonica]XP_034049539.1 monocarboxylate transporter 7-like [Thalassophryne amazonica]